MRAPDWLTARPVAHRGLHNAARGVIENMPGAANAAIARNFAIEVDLQVSRDGEAMVHHDFKLGRLNDGDAKLLDLTASELKAVTFKQTSERMMTLGDLCDLTDRRVPLVLEMKSDFSGDRRLASRMATVLGAYQGPVAAMSFDPDQMMAIREAMPKLTRGIVAQRTYSDSYWSHVSDDQRNGMLHLRHGLRTQPHFVAYSVNELPAPAPWIARNIFGCALLTWTVRTPEQRTIAGRYSDQMIFEGFVPD